MNEEFVRAAGAANQVRGKNNGANTNISFLSFNRATSTKGASVFGIPTASVGMTEARGTSQPLLLGRAALPQSVLLPFQYRFFYAQPARWIVNFLFLF
jgi:hypothetical protein